MSNQNNNTVATERSWTSFKMPIFIPSIAIIILVTLVAAIFPTEFSSYLDVIKQKLFKDYSWFYVLAVAIFLSFLTLLCVSRFGNVKLGDEDEKPEFRYVSWMAMLFAAGTGIGVMFYGVAEPVMHYQDSVISQLPEGQRVATSITTSIFHWGISAWAIYAVVGLSLAYFGFRYKLPLTIRSGLYPLLKGKTTGFWGHVIDVVALISTIFGVTTTLGYGALQMDAGLRIVGILGPESNFTSLTIIIFVVMTLATISAISGVAKGVRILSEINFGLALVLLAFVLVAGPTLYLLYSFSENLGNYLTNLIQYSFRTFAYDEARQGWFYGWTVLYWAWWVSWAPFVGLFIARISRGRTIREFILGVLFIPSLFYILWVSIFGNGALYFQEIAQVFTDKKTEEMLFLFLNQLPWGSISSFFAICIIGLFFITSADSGIFVINNIASQGKDSNHKWQGILWGVMLAVLAIVLLKTGGIGALQTMTLIIALPFTLIMLLSCYGLWKGLEIDQEYYNRGLAHGSVHWTADNWKERLDKIINVADKREVNNFIKNTCFPAFNRLKDELLNQGLDAHVQYGHTDKTPTLELRVHKEGAIDFIYGIKGAKRTASETVVDSASVPHIETHNYFIPFTYFEDGRRGYDVSYMDEDELIVDVLKQYERHLGLMLSRSTDLFTIDNEA